MVDGNDDTMQQDTPSGAKTKRTDPQDHDGSDHGEHEPQDATAEDMNFDETLFHNSTPHEQYGGVPDWMLQPGAAGPPSPVTSKPHAGFPRYGASDSFEQALGPASLTREERATEYAMLAAARRNANTEADADGKIQEPHMHDV